MRLNFRNLSTLLTATGCWALLATASVAQEGEYKPLFDGKTLEGWEGKEQFWSVQDGAITGVTTADNPTEGNTFLVYKGGEVADFDLKLKFKIVGGNSGIQYRSSDVGNFVVGGYQADIDSGTTYIGILYEERGRGILAQRTQSVLVKSDGTKEVAEEKTCAEEAFLKAVKKEDWNEYRIVAKGNKLQHYINGFKTVEIVDEQESKAKRSGILALQLHAGPPMTVQFKDIEIKTLK